MTQPLSPYIQTTSKKMAIQKDNDVFFDFSLTVKAVPHGCVSRTDQP